MTTTTKRIYGREAIEWAEKHGLETVESHSSAVDDGGPVSLDTAYEICREDPMLVYVDVEA